MLSAERIKYDPRSTTQARAVLLRIGSDVLKHEFAQEVYSVHQ
jgi:hypothetical protein